MDWKLSASRSSGMFLTLIMLSCIVISSATKCPHCGKDFVKLGSHQWRCKGRITSSIPAPIGPIDDPMPSTGKTTTVLNSLTPMNEPILETPLIKCVCGRLCKGRRGLRAHQRCCQMHKTLSTQYNDDKQAHDADHSTYNLVDGVHSDEFHEFHSVDGVSLTTVQGSADNSNFERASNDELINSKPTYKPGLKLPKTPSDWSLANAYFHAHLEIQNISGNLDQFELDMQKQNLWLFPK